MSAKLPPFAATLSSFNPTRCTKFNTTERKKKKKKKLRKENWNINGALNISFSTKWKRTFQGCRERTGGEIRMFKKNYKYLRSNYTKRFNQKEIKI